MDKHRKYRYIAAFCMLGAGVFVFFVLYICMGSVEISVREMMRAFAGVDDMETKRRILWDIRFPRAMAALILGGALALAGYLLQTFFHNPIAGPFVLGISSGAKMTVALVMIFLMGRTVRVTSADLIAAAFTGALLSMGVVLLLSRRVRGMSMLVVCGVIIGYICSAVTELVVTFAEDADIVNLHNWSRGSFSGMTWENVKVMAAVVIVTVFLVFRIAKPLGAYQMGETYAAAWASISDFCGRASSSFPVCCRRVLSRLPVRFPLWALLRPIWSKSFWARRNRF